MISRRTFLTALAAVPFVGKLIPQEWTVITEVGPSAISERALMAEMAAGIFVDAERFTPKQMQQIANALQSEYMEKYVHLRPRLTFAEWDRTYQG